MKCFQMAIFSLLMIIPQLLISQITIFDTTHVSTRAYNSETNMPAFQQDVLTTYNGYQYSTFWSRDKCVSVGRRKIGTRTWQVVELTDYVSPNNLSDNHYSISIGICPGDGTIHLCFDQHSTHMNYRKSVAGMANNPEDFNWTLDEFGKTTYKLESGFLSTVTYPRFLIAPDNKLIFVCRIGTSGNGDSHIWEYDGETGEWTTLGIFIDGVSSDENPYLNGVNFDPSGRLHVSWCWRGTPDPTTNHDIYYAYSDDQGRTWKNNAGEVRGTTGDKATALRRDMTDLKVWTIPQNRGLINQESQIVDSQGRIHVLMSHLEDSEPSTTDFWGARARAYNYHYYRDLEGTWHRNPLNALVNGRNPIAVDANDNLYAVLGKGRVYGASAASGWQWKSLNEEIDSRYLLGEGAIDRAKLMDYGVLSFVYVWQFRKLVVWDFPLENLLAGVEDYETERNLENKRFTLFQNFPNPFNMQTEIEYEIHQPGTTDVSIFNLNGELVRNFAEGEQAVGLKHVKWDGRDQSGNFVSSGIYFLRVQLADEVSFKKIILQK